MNEQLPPHHVATGKNDPAANYSTRSLLIHWLGAIAVIVLFLTHEGEWLGLHLSLGLVLTLPLIYRVTYRWNKGFPRPVNQHPALNFLSRLVMIGMLVSVFLVTVSGVLLPVFEGTAYPFFGFGEWTAPFGGNPLIYALLEEVHDLAGHAIIPLFGLHILGFAKHVFFDKKGSKTRMLKPLDGGR